MKKEIKKIKEVEYSFKDLMHTTVLTFEDDTKKYIFIERGMIFVCDFDLDELTRRIEADDIDSYEAFDTSDGLSYYLDCDYADEISDALLDLVNTVALI